ncbi:hypothetical protein [Streptomyces cellulosae]|uniref:hypothetical protein n=1 Tax=Streptomyces cellulosae TaxID=1968 RepID=UPI0004C8C1C0|nr:hypothetical protein [Streptomyces cellulosae]
MAGGVVQEEGQARGEGERRGNAILLHKDVWQYATFDLFAVAFLVAAWAGASLVGRELEQSTVRPAWTQGVSPRRWLTAKLAVPAVPVTLGTGLLVLLHHLRWSAGDGRIGTAKDWYSGETSFANGKVPVVLTLPGPAAGALLGLLTGRCRSRRVPSCSGHRPADGGRVPSAAQPDPRARGGARVRSRRRGGRRMSATVPRGLPRTVLRLHRTALIA